MEKLTRRELECAAMVAQGRTNDQIAEALHLQSKTVRYHLSEAYRVLGFGNNCNQRVSLALLVRERDERAGCG